MCERAGPEHFLGEVYQQSGKELQHKGKYGKGGGGGGGGGEDGEEGRRERKGGGGGYYTSVAALGLGQELFRL